MKHLPVPQTHGGLLRGHCLVKPNQVGIIHRHSSLKTKQTNKKTCCETDFGFFFFRMEVNIRLCAPPWSELGGPPGLFWCPGDVTGGHTRLCLPPPSTFPDQKVPENVYCVVSFGYERASHPLADGHMWRFTLQGNGSVEATFSMARFLMLGVSGPRQVGQQLSFWRQWLQTR